MAEFPDLGKHCSVQFCKQIDFLPFDCDGCGKSFCVDHKFPDDHKCDQVNINTATGDYTGDRSYSCTFEGCQGRELMKVTCVQCQKNFCLSHRHQSDHNCEKLELKEDKTKTAEHVRQIIASKPVKASPAPLKGGKSSKTAAKVVLMKLKMHAVGDKGIPQDSRVFFLVYLPKDSKQKTKPMFFSKTWTVGRVIDSVADFNNIVNTNNTGSKQKLRMFLHSCGTLLDTEASLELCLQQETLYNGSSVIVESVATDCSQINNMHDYKS
ncbi:AN1-type zinc finger protein 1-like [Mizuhopecten yessoensis]|uniref:AN1-type zinc finger protein 1-like n=1 Tax=Mizuhopecten yessoensis TaxID=6573 RepID=UPI000B45E71E|nr:AN1-type zinc finger protein 1-like [Mizuhopecten yessoensis]